MNSRLDPILARRLAGALMLALAATFGWLLLTPRGYESGLGTPVEAAELTPRGTLPAIAITTLDGQTLTNQSFAGKVTVLHFWGTHCPPCVGEIPTLREEYPAELAKLPSLQFIALASDTSVRELERFVSSRGITWPVAASGDPGTNAVWGTLGVNETPTTVIVDPGGQIRWRGTRLPGNLKEIVQSLSLEVVQSGSSKL